MTGFAIREWVEGDFSRYFDIRRSVDPTVDADYAARVFRGEIGERLLHQVATVDGYVVAFVIVIVMPMSDRPMMGLVVDEKFRGHGIGTALIEGALTQFGDRTLGSSCRDSDPRFLTFAARYGFEVKQHGIRSRLDAADVHQAPIDLGFTFEILTDDELTPDKEVAVSELMVGGATNPEVTELGWRIDIATMRKFLTHGIWVVAWDGDKAIAHTDADMVPDADWQIGFTVVAPGYRGRGLSRNIKQILHQYGVQQGAPGFETENEERNTAIRSLNESMGYRVIGGDYRLIRPGTTS